MNACLASGRCHLTLSFFRAYQLFFLAPFGLSFFIVNRQALFFYSIRETSKEAPFPFPAGSFLHVPMYSPPILLSSATDPRPQPDHAIFLLLTVAEVFFQAGLFPFPF